MARLAQAWMQGMTQLRARPLRFGYVLMALVLGVVVFSLSDYLPAPYEMGH